MNPIHLPPLVEADADEEISALIATLHATGKRLEELTGGQVDAVADAEGGTFLLRRAQDQLRRRQADKQAAILDALPAHIAMIDAQGVILSVNEAWRQFAGTNALQHPGHAVGLNYIEVCDNAQGSGAFDARAVAKGIRAVLAGAEEFSFEYACHAPTEQRWFLMRVTPLDTGAHGAVVMHVNITDRKRAEDAVRSSEISMATAQSIAHFGSWEVDLTVQDNVKAGRLRWSDEMFRIAGHEPGSVEVSNELFFSLVHPDDREPIHKAVARAIRERTQYSIVHRLVRPDGEVRVVHERAQIFFDESNDCPVKIIGTAHDITHRRKAEEALHLSERQQRELAQQLELEGARLVEAQAVAKVGSWETDMATMEVVWSEQTHRIFETDPAQFSPTHESFLQLVHAEDRSAVDQAFFESLSQRSACAMGHRVLLPDGRIKFVEQRWQTIFDDEGTPIRVLGTCQDITERKIAEEALRESEERFRGTFEQAAVGIAHVSTGGRFLRVNDKLCVVLGYDRAELLVSTFMELTLPEDEAGALEARRAMLAGTQASFTSEKRYRRKSGELVWVNLVTTLERTQNGDPKYFISIFEDISARKTMEESLHRSQALLRMAGRLSRMGPWSVELPEDKVRWSEEVCAIHEAPPGTCPTVEEAFNNLTPECRETARTAFEKCICDGTPYDLEFQLITQTGRRIWVRSICEAEKDETGVIRRLQGNLQDISDRKQASEAMQKQQTELRVLFDLMPAMIWFKDTQNGILRVNQRVAEVAGKSVEDIEGRPSLEVYPNDAARFYADDLEVIRSGVPRMGYVERLRGPNEQDIWVQTDKVPYCDKDGRVIGIVVMAQDITERKQAEQRIAEQAALIDESRDAIVVTDLDRRVTFWSKGAERLYGWTPDEAKGCPLNKMLQVDAEKFKSASQAVRLTGEWNGEIQKIARRGAVLTVDSRWTLMRDALGRPHSILTISTDITERKKSEKQFLRSQRMESIGTLAGGIAHDLNNVLAPILMGVDFMKLKYPGASDILDRFEISANRGAGMVRQLLTFAKGAEGERVSIQTTHLVMEIKELMQGTFPKNIEIRVSCEQGLPTVLGDASQLHQILLNLCVNARDAMPSGGTLTVEARSLDVDTIFAAAVPDAKPGRYVILRVRDTGTGIPAALLERIFDPFFTTKGADKGTGLGLSTVMGLAKGLGGFLHVDSTPGEGSTFDVHLPAEMEDFSSARAPIVEADRGGHGETILLVDDEAGVLEVGRLVLTDLNYKVLTAIDGAHGLVKAIENSRELRAVITDMHMPHMDGLAFVHALHRVLPDIPVIIGSGRLDDTIAEELKLLGVTERLDKPYTQPMLAAILTKVMAGGTTVVG